MDGNGVIENLGVDNIVKIQKNAAISRAESEKEIAKAQANANAEAMAKMGEAAVLEMYFKALPEVVKNAAMPLENVDRITMYGDGNKISLRFSIGNKNFA